MELLSYVDFWIDGINIRSTYNLWRVSNGDEGYEMPALPEMENQTSEISGNDGTYYFGTYYRNKELELQLAFDKMYREDWEKFIVLLKRNQYHTLVFYEQPYKVYKVRLNGIPQITAIPYDEPEEKDKRILFKGTGSISFICDDVFAHSVSKDPYDYRSYENLQEWIGESGIIDLSGYNRYHPAVQLTTPQEVLLWNGGHVPTHYILHFTARTTTDRVSIQLVQNGNVLTDYSIDTTINKEFYINSKTHLIGNKDFTKLYSTFYSSIPNIQPIPVGDSKLIVAGYSGSSMYGLTELEIDYDYLYF